MTPAPKHYLHLWLLLSAAFALCCAYRVWSERGSFDSTSIKETLLQAHTEPVNQEVKQASAPTVLDSVSILLIGDSMLEGLSPRLAKYANNSGHKLHTVIWYGSGCESWGKSERLKDYIRIYNPGFVVIVLGSNELFTRSPEKKGEYIEKLKKQLAGLPYLWIGPANWKEDTGINRVLQEHITSQNLFITQGMSLERSADGMHPTRQAAAQWMDSVIRWLPRHAPVYPRFKVKGVNSAPDHTASLKLIPPP